jgi:hypothetical protein
MIKSRATVPLGHGELVLRPEYAEWKDVAEKNRRASGEWDFSVAGTHIAAVREQARRELLESASAFSARLGTGVQQPRGPSDAIVMTGHQPELFHPGVWAKHFLLQRIANDLGATAVDVVVDTDGFASIAVTAPCMAPEVRRCTQYLAIGTKDNCFACTAPPAADDVDQFCRTCDQLLSTLPAPAVRRHFGEFCDALGSARVDASNLSELLTFARRRYEAPTGTDYLELPITDLIRGRSFADFVADMALGARRFSEVYNDELGKYRSLNNTRSTAQPFPNLEIGETRVELPLWAIEDGRRQTVYAQESPTGVRLLRGERPIVDLPRDGIAAASLLQETHAQIAPKAVALTLFVRVFCCDLFIHGVGGGRYDVVTNGVCRRFYGVEPPSFVVASLTMYLPLGAHNVTDDELAVARKRLNTLAHNPDSLLGEVQFETEAEREEAVRLASEKDVLVREIASPDADKKVLGAKIREVNATLAEILLPLREEYTQELTRLEAQRQATEVFTNRGYPYCLWSPEEIADKVR